MSGHLVHLTLLWSSLGESVFWMSCIQTINKTHGVNQTLQTLFFFTIKEIFLIIYSGMEFDFRDKYSNPALFNLETSDNRLLFVEEKQLGKVTNFGMIVVLPWWGQESCLKFPVVQFK